MVKPDLLSYQPHKQIYSIHNDNDIYSPPSTDYTDSNLSDNDSVYTSSPSSDVDSSFMLNNTYSMDNDDILYPVDSYTKYN